MQIMGTNESVRGSTTPTVLICMGHLCFGHLYGGRKKRHVTTFISRQKKISAKQE